MVDQIHVEWLLDCLKISSIFQNSANNTSSTAKDSITTAARDILEPKQQLKTTRRSHSPPLPLEFHYVDIDFYIDCGVVKRISLISPEHALQQSIYMKYIVPSCDYIIATFSFWGVGGQGKGRLCKNLVRYMYCRLALRDRQFSSYVYIAICVNFGSLYRFVCLLVHNYSKHDSMITI